jgi:hypothetical protein
MRDLNSNNNGKSVKPGNQNQVGLNIEHSQKLLTVKQKNARVVPFCFMGFALLHSNQLFNGLKSSPPQHSSLSKLVNHLQYAKLSF